MTETKQKSTDMEKKQRQAGLWAAGIFSTISLIFLGFSIVSLLVVQKGQANISDYVLLPLTILMTSINLISFFLIRRGRFMTGVWLLVALNMVIPPILVTLVLKDLYPTAISYTSILAILLVFLVFPRVSRWQVLPVTALTILVIIGIEFWNPAFRVSSSANLPSFTIAVEALTGAILFLLFVVYMWNSGRLRNRIVALLVVVLTPLLVIYSYISIRAQQQDLEDALLDRAKAAAITQATFAGKSLEDAIDGGLLTTDKVFDQNYVKFFEFDPSKYPEIEDDPSIYDKYHTAYDAYTDEHWQAMFDSYLTGPDMLYAVVSDINGYVPTHNTVFSTGDGDPATDRTKRIFSDPIGLTAARNTEPTLQQIYLQSGTGATLWDISAPVYVNGKHWGGVRIGVQLAQNQERVQAATLRAVVSSSILLALILVFAWLIGNYITNPIERLTKVSQEAASGNLNARIDIPGRDEITTLAQAFNSMTAQIQEFIGSLEGRVTERTQSLELAAEVGRSVSQVRALDVLLKDAAELIRSRFDLYYVQVYLTDPSQTNLILQSGTGAVGAELVERSHRLPLNAASINGRAAVEKHSIVVADTVASPTFRANELLPETRSEMAVPLLIGEKVVGVLDLQSQVAGALNQDVLPAYEALAGQLAIAIQNATFLAETQQANVAIEAHARRLTRANWVDYLDAIHRPEEIGFVFEQNKISPLIETEPAKDNALTAPITLTGETLGNLIVEMERQSPIARTDELLSAVARQVAQQVENLRLLESAERYRLEAENAARRLTREGWEEYFSAKSGQTLGYLYDLKEVRPHKSGAEFDTDSSLSLPIKVRDETIGKLAVQGVDSTDPEILALVNTVSVRLSEHIESIRLLEETQLGQMELNKRARQLAAVSQISTLSSRELDVQKMLATVVQMAQRQFGLYHAHIFTYNEAANQLEIVACGWKEGGEHEGTHGTTTISLDQEQSLVARAARTRAPVAVNDVRDDPNWLPNPQLPDTLSELAVPLVIGDEVLGVLDVQSEHANAFSDADINIQSTLAAQVATALQNARSFARAQRQAEREATLNAISQKIQSATSVEAVLQIAARELGHALGAPRTIAQLSMKDNK